MALPYQLKCAGLVGPGLPQLLLPSVHSNGGKNLLKTDFAT